MPSANADTAEMAGFVDTMSTHPLALLNSVLCPKQKATSFCLEFLKDLEVEM